MGGFRTCHLFMAAAAAFVLLGLTFSSSSVGGGGGVGKIGGLLEPFKGGSSERENKKDKMTELVDSIPDSKLDSMPDPGMLKNVLKGMLNN